MVTDNFATNTISLHPVYTSMQLQEWKIYYLPNI